MGSTQTLYIILCLTCCVSADGWDDFTNNLATDLAPLITLFGEQITRQCLSELTSTLDDFIFALAPLGILTAVVSLIRVCGNSTLRAFIGRAQEDPADSEREILSCVSDTTAEIFTESGVARITGSPTILEIVIDEGQGQNGSLTVKTLSELAIKGWPTDIEKDFKLPNLSLNKGIRRRAPFWFYFAACFGVALQSGVIIYAILTVWHWPDAFLKDGSRVDSYALPMFVAGTILLTLGMFFCAFLVDNFSTKHRIALSDDSRVYWVQPGNQKAGDQTFPSFVGRTDKGIAYIRSVRLHSPDKVLNVSTEIALVSVVFLTMAGFIVQFVGLRGLHSSVILAQLGATMVMTVVRTSLRAQRMHERDNVLGNDQNEVSIGENELDWLVFHLFQIESFEICSVFNLPQQMPPTPQGPAVSNILMTRTKLRNLAGSNWDGTPLRRLASRLELATQGLLALIKSWMGEEVEQFDIIFPVEINGKDNQQAVSHHWEKRLSSRENVDFWECILGLYLWSLRKANRGIDDRAKTNFFRALRPSNKSSHQTHLLFQKWIDHNAILKTNSSRPRTLLDKCQTFGHLDYHTDSQILDHTTLIAVSSQYYTLAAQDIYLHVLHTLLEQIPVIDEPTEIKGEYEKGYKLYNHHINLLAISFASSGLGNENEGMVCILPVLSDRGLLPEITYDSTEFRRHMHELEHRSSNEEILYVSEWFCSVADHGEVERALNEYGYICLRNLMDENEIVGALAFERIIAVTKAHEISQNANSISQYLTNIASMPPASWLKKYRSEMFWLASRILQFQVVGSHSQQARNHLQELERQASPELSLNELFHNQEAAIASQSAILDLWYEVDSGDLLSDRHVELILDWLVDNKHESLLEWLLRRLVANPYYSHENMRKMITYAAEKRYKEAAETIWRLADKSGIRGSTLEGLASEGDVRTLEFLLDTDFSSDSTSLHANALLQAAESMKSSVIECLLAGGVDVDTCNHQGESALIIAARKGDNESISVLLSHNASLEIHDSSGDTALITAALHSHSSVVELLSSHGADVNAIGYRGRTALMAATLGRNLPLVKYLCEHKADVHVLSVDRSSVLDVAARKDIGYWAEGCAYLESLGVKRYKGKKYEDF